MKNIKVSIIIPVYNVEKYIEECLDSVLAQSVKEIEVILIDDCSEDNSGSICDEYAAKDGRIRVIHKNVREGAASARNTGIEIATGMYVGFVDSDDKISTNMYEKLYDLAVANNADMVCCELVTWYLNRQIAMCSNSECIILDANEALVELHKRKAVYPYLCNKLIKRELVDSVNNNDEIIVGEDYKVLLNVLMKSNKVMHVSEGFYYYRQRKTSVCNNGFSEKYKGVLMNYRSIANELCEKYPDNYAVFNNYCYVEELAIMVAMAKNGAYDAVMAGDIKCNIRNNLSLLLRNNYVGMQYKISGIILSISSHLFVKLMTAYIKIRNKLNVLFD